MDTSNEMLLTFQGERLLQITDKILKSFNRAFFVDFFKKGTTSVDCSTIMTLDEYRLICECILEKLGTPQNLGTLKILCKHGLVGEYWEHMDDRNFSYSEIESLMHFEFSRTSEILWTNDVGVYQLLKTLLIERSTSTNIVPIQVIMDENNILIISAWDGEPLFRDQDYYHVFTDGIEPYIYNIRTETMKEYNGSHRNDLRGLNHLRSSIFCEQREIGECPSGINMIGGAKFKGLPLKRIPVNIAPKVLTDRKRNIHKSSPILVDMFSDDELRIFNGLSCLKMMDGVGTVPTTSDLLHHYYRFDRPLHPNDERDAILDAIVSMIVEIQPPPTIKSSVFKMSLGFLKLA